MHFPMKMTSAVQAVPISTAPAKDSMDANVSAPPQTAVAKEAELCDEICVAGPADVEKVKTTETEENKENHQAEKAEGVGGFLGSLKYAWMVEEDLLNFPLW